MNINDVRGLFPVLGKRAYMFSGGIAPASTLMLNAINQFTENVTNNPANLYKNTRDDFVEARSTYANLIGADEDEIVVTDSTGTGSNISVEMIDPKPGSNVVFDENSYPSAVYPWMLPARQHIEKRFVKATDGIIQLGDLSKAIDKDTIAVSISHVSQTTGFRHNLGAIASIAHDHDALLLVDAMQSAGALAIDVHKLNVDFLSTGAMKYLLGTAGVGFLYVARRHLDSMPPHAGGPGAISSNKHEFIPKPGAERFQIGMPNLMGLAASIPGLKLLTEVGINNVEEHILDLTGYCIEGLKKLGQTVLTPMKAEYRAGIVAIEIQGATELDSFLVERKVDGYPYGQRFRVDPHFFNNRDDVDRFLQGLDAFLKSR